MYLTKKLFLLTTLVIAPFLTLLPQETSKRDLVKAVHEADISYYYDEDYVKAQTGKSKKERGCSLSSMTAPFFFYLFTGDSIKPKKNLKNQKVFVNSTCIIRRNMLQY